MSENKPPKIVSNKPLEVYNDEEIQLLRDINLNLKKIERNTFVLWIGFGVIIIQLTGFMSKF